MTDEKLLSGALKYAKYQKLSGIESNATILADALNEAVEALRNLVQSPVVVADERMDYIIVQIDRGELQDAMKILSKYQEGK